jgi:L-iditol 2-dehydrogenase
MKAAILYGKEDVRIEEIEPKTLQAGEARIQIEAALTCGTDLKVFKRGYHARMIVPPAVFGHEFAGLITELRPDESPIAGIRGPEKVNNVPAEAPLNVGDRVVVANSAPCGQCYYCQNLQENLCDDLMFLNGAYAESIVVPARLVQKNLLRLKPATQFRDAALTEPLACVVQGIEEARLRPGQRVLVIGAGPIGLMFVALSRQVGCAVAVAGRGESRLRAAKSLGAETVIDVSGQADLVTAVPRGRGFDVVIEAVGQPQTWEAAVQLVRKGGAVNFFGGCPSGTTVSLDTQLIHYSNLTLLATFHHTPRSIRQALAHIESGLIRAADFVTGECGLRELPALLKSMAASNRAVKTLIRARDSAGPRGVSACPTEE